MSNLVIVALPAEDDYIHKISSEKVPHMTLLFLGEDVSKVKNLAMIIDFVKHAAERSLCRFGMEVDRRGVLGPEQADVLFFSKTRWSGFETVKDYRSYLLKDNNIKIAYDSADQHPEWIPHLTLGFPDTPAKPDKRDYPGTTYVSFDRIAVWFGDYEGIEFPLKTQEWDDMAVGWSNTEEVVDDILKHFGKKGMKWGVRKTVDTAIGTKTSGRKPGSKAATSKDRRKDREDSLNRQLRVGKTSKDFKDSRKDAKFQRKTIGGFYPKTTNAIIKDAHKSMKPEIKALKKQPEFSSFKAKRAIRKAKLDLHPTDPIAKKYNKIVSDIYMKHVEANASKHLKVSPSGKWQQSLVIGEHSWNVSMKRVDSAVHANLSDADVEFRVRPIFDDVGYIVDFETLPLEDSLSQTSLLVEDILTHHGTLGMKWGSRKGGRSSGPQAVTISNRGIGGKKIRARGGGGHPAHADAVRARTHGRIAKKSGVKALSNKDLEEFNKRLNLEQNASRLTFNDKSKGSQFVSKLMGRGANKGVDTGVQGGKAAMKSVYVRKKIAIGAAALVL